MLRNEREKCFPLGFVEKLFMRKNGGGERDIKNMVFPFKTIALDVVSKFLHFVRKFSPIDWTSTPLVENKSSENFRSMKISKFFRWNAKILAFLGQRG